MTATTTNPPAGQSATQGGSIKETIVSLIIAFVMALVFRSYVVEAFIIPTGSMAPTLLGAHMNFRSPESGYGWSVNPWYEDPPESPTPIQGGGQWGAPTATDPMSTTQLNQIHPGGRPPNPRGYVTPPEPKPLLQGDRILVQKYLYEIFPPRRWDVVVFKNPEESTINFIKRLVGLPGEQVWIAGGDIFTRPINPNKGGSAPEPTGPWQVQRKPVSVQRSLWRPIYWSQYAPLDPVRDGAAWFSDPWSGDGWQTGGRSDYRCDTDAPTELAWDTGRWPIWDWVPYNEVPVRLGGTISKLFEQFPVSDLRLCVGVRPDRPGLALTASIRARGHEFQGLIKDGRAIVRLRTLTAEKESPWTELAGAAAPALAAGRVTNVEFWHVDQSLQIWIDGRLIVSAEYNWGPSERLRWATGQQGDAYSDDEHLTGPNALAQAATYAADRPEISWFFQGSPVTLSRVGLDRDLYYEAVNTSRSGPAFATHPNTLANLSSDQYFVLGDNSPASKDGRLWDRVDPWVADQIDGKVGVVPRKLLLGKAFFVYFPSPYTLGGRLPIPDFGSMRFIR